MRIHGHKYKRHFTEEGYRCFYCGDSAQCLDHVPALSWIDSLDTPYRRTHNIPTSLIPACFECNKALGDKPLHTVVERLDYLESHYDKKFSKQQSLWDEEEIESLGFNLRAMVRHHQGKVMEFLTKLRGVQSRLYKTETFPVFNNEDFEPF